MEVQGEEEFIEYSRKDYASHALEADDLHDPDYGHDAEAEEDVRQFGLDADSDVVPVHSAERLGEYEIVGNIAEGSFGKVKLAVHTITSIRVALKYLSKAAITNQHLRHRVKREYEYMTQLQSAHGTGHENIVKLYEVISTPGEIIFVLEYAPNELFQFISNNGAMEEDMGRRYFQQLISGIQYAHQRQIVHRDLKPENILLDTTLSTLKITDFGLSSAFTDGDFLHTSCGSPSYASPEVIEGKVYAGPEIDVWSAGVILYVMLTGRLPFDSDEEGNAIDNLYIKIRAGDYPRPVHLSLDAQDLISKMLVVDPIQRITIPHILTHPWVQSSTYTAYSCSAVDTEEEVIDMDVARELATLMHDVTVNDVLDALESETNTMKVAYMLLRDSKKIPSSLTPSAPTSPPDSPPLSPHTFCALPSPIPASAKKPSRPKWHFGITSKSPKMEIMLEIYKALKELGMQWRATPAGKQRDWYLIEVRARQGELVVLFNIQLYSVQTDTYLVDLAHKGSYKAVPHNEYDEDYESRFDRAQPEESPSAGSERGSGAATAGTGTVCSPYAFMDAASRLVLYLAGG